MDENSETLVKEEEVARKKNNNGNGIPKVRSIIPLTENQKRTFDTFPEKNLFLHGWAGTGKTFLGMYLSLREIIEKGSHEKLFIVRSAVASRAIGYLPGDLWEKLEVFEAPYKAICNDLLQRSDGYEYLKTKGQIEFISTSYLRGVTLDNCVVLVDEIQNFDWGELSTTITRVGNNTRLIFCGDHRQSDFRGHETASKQDVRNFMDVIEHMDTQFEFIEFDVGDIIRSELAKDFLLKAYALGYDGC